MNVFANQKNRRDKSINGTLLLGTITSEVKLENDKGVNGIFYDVTDMNGLIYSNVPVLNNSGSGNDVGQTPVYKKNSSVLIALISKNSPPIILGGLQFAPGLLPSSLVNSENIQIQNGENKIQIAGSRSDTQTNNSMSIEANGNMIFKSNKGKFKFVSGNKVSTQHPLNGEDAVTAVFANMTNFATELAAAYQAITNILDVYNKAVQAAIATTTPDTLVGYAAFMSILVPATTGKILPDNLTTALDKSDQTNLTTIGATNFAKDLATTLNKLIELPNNK